MTAVAPPGRPVLRCVREPKVVKFGHSRKNGMESFEDGTALPLPTGDVHVTMWGGENTSYVTTSWTRGRLAQIVAVHSRCNSPAEVQELSLQAYPDEVRVPPEVQRRRVRESVLKVVREITAHCGQKTEDLLLEVVLGHLKESHGLGEARRPTP